MKHPILKPLLLLLLPAILPALSACSKEFDDEAYDTSQNASSSKEEHTFETANSQSFTFIATLHQTEAGEYYLQVDATLRVYPANILDLCPVLPETPCRIVGDMTAFDRQMEGGLGYYGLLDWFDFVEQGPVLNEADEGKDGDDVLADWMTSLEDGFLTLHFQTWWGVEPRRHELRLVIGSNPDDPYELLLVHNANDDPKSYQADALVCFDLQDAIPVPEDPTQTTVTLKWTNDTGQTQFRTFPYAGRY